MPLTTMALRQDVGTRQGDRRHHRGQSAPFAQVAVELPVGALVRVLASPFSRQRLWEVDMATSGTDITRLREFQEADVIHLSWINQGMLSLKNIRKIIRSGKPVVWTMHDLWPATGICHYARGCNRYASACGNCPLLPNKAARPTSQQRYSAARRNSTIAAPSPSSPVAVGSNGRLRAAVSS